MAVNNLSHPKALALAKRTERRRRTRRIRQGVTAGTITLFVAFFSTIYVQMAAGHDPALSGSTRTTPAVATTTSSGSSAPSSDSDSSSGTDSTGSTGTTPSSGTASSSGGTSSSTGATASAPAPVTTQQS